MPMTPSVSLYVGSTSPFGHAIPCCAPFPCHQLNATSVGRPVRFETLSLEELQLCMLCVLRALEALHGSHDEEGKGLVHRDIRWPNIVLCAHLAPDTSAWLMYYKLIDLESVAREGQVRGDFIGNIAALLSPL